MTDVPGFPIRIGNTLEDWVTIDGKWHHLAVIVGPDPRVYIDGTDTHRQDGIAVFDRVLTRDEIEEHYAAIVADSQVGYWRLGEPPSDPAAPLREFLEAIRPFGSDERVLSPSMVDKIMDQAPKAAPPSDPAAPLDVERLARALLATANAYEPSLDQHYEWWETPRYLAVAIAREYAALTPVPKAAPPSDPAAPLDVERLTEAFSRGGARLHEETWHVHEDDLPAIEAALATPAPKEADRE